MRTLLPRAGRRGLLAIATVLALAAAGVAIAGSGTPASTTLFSATFSANTAGPSHSSTCTPTPGDTYTTTDAVFSGNSSGDPRFTGAMTIHVKSVYDSTTNVGSLKGHVDINTTTNPPGHVDAKLSAVNVNGVVQGWLDGDLGGGTHFIGSFSANLSLTGTTVGFSNGALGAGAATNTAIVSTGHCDQPHPNPPHANPPPHEDHGHHGHHGDQHGKHDH